MPKRVDHAARRREIAAVAADLIARGGLEAATIREIAAASGYSKGVVEHYFVDKQELISGALDWINACYAERVAAATDGLEGLAALRRRVEATVPLDRAVRSEWRVRLVFWSVAAIDDSLRRAQAIRSDRAVKVFRDDIRAALAAGEIPLAGDADEWARRVVNVTTGLSIATLHDPARYTRPFLISEIERLLDHLRAARPTCPERR